MRQAPRHQPSSEDETFYGFIKEPVDALLVIEGCIHGILKTFTGAASTVIRSGSCFVFPDNSTQMKRWRDGERWSPSRAHGSFLLYREVESTRHSSTATVNESEDLYPHIPGLEPSFSDKTLKPNTRLVPEGLTKRTISLFGSDGQKYRVISYYSRKDGVQVYSPAGDHDETTLRSASEVLELKALTERKDIDFKALLNRSVGVERKGQFRKSESSSDSYTQIKKRDGGDVNEMAAACEGLVSLSKRHKVEHEPVVHPTIANITETPRPSGSGVQRHTAISAPTTIQQVYQPRMQDIQQPLPRMQPTAVTHKPPQTVHGIPQWQPQTQAWQIAPVYPYYSYRQYEPVTYLQLPSNQPQTTPAPVHVHYAAAPSNEFSPDLQHYRNTSLHSHSVSLPLPRPHIIENVSEPATYVDNSKKSF